MTDNETLFRDSLRPEVAAYVEKNGAFPGFDIAIVDTTPVSEMSATVEAMESIISRFDFDASVRAGGLYNPPTKKSLARWFANGATPEAREMLRIRAVRDIPQLEVWKFVDAAVPADYLGACISAGIRDSDLIADGSRNGVSIEYLTSL